MKKIDFTIILMVLLTCIGCESRQTPDTDGTKLYPAKDSIGESWGFINGKGYFVIQPSFDKVSAFSCGYAKVEKDGACKFIDKKGNICSTISFDNASDFYYGYSTIQMDGEYGLLDVKMNMVIQPHFKALGLMGDNGLIAAKREYDSNYEYIDVNENTKIPPMFDYADAFKDGIAVVKVSGKYGAINPSGDFAIQPTYKYPLENLGNGLISYRSDDFKLGLLNKQGEVVVASEYMQFGQVSEGLIPFMSKSDWGYMNTKGEIVIPAIYAKARPFNEGYAWVTNRLISGSYYCINTNAQVVFELPEGEVPVTEFHNGLSLVQSNDSCTYVNTQGDVIYSWPGTADSIWDLF